MDKIYQNKAHELEKSKLDWKKLASLDYRLTRELIDEHEKRTRKIDVGDFGCNIVSSNFLRDEYETSLRWLKFDVVKNLPVVNSFSPLGVIACVDIAEKIVLPGLVGLLSEIKEIGVVEGVNDFSLIQSQRLKKLWLMLGPISFINSSCKPNAKYVRLKSCLMTCVPIRSIKPGEEKTVLYNRHAFGEFNVDCLCPLKSCHGPPFADLPIRAAASTSASVRNVTEETPTRSSSGFLEENGVRRKFTRPFVSQFDLCSRAPRSLISSFLSSDNCSCSIVSSNNSDSDSEQMIPFLATEMYTVRSLFA